MLKLLDVYFQSESLAATNKEADTRTILHAVDEDSKFTSNVVRIVIKPPDIDVVVLALYYFPKSKHVSEFWIETGRVKKTADQRRVSFPFTVFSSLWGRFSV